ncbi:hypothetical protein QM012_002604 [Aureobasidium pullulans]|uniref:C2H2-type domain-containing protein n=1 Tax=Aureobasidium pullulans TaxID=5580 RepID=A0ABR0TA27_AURPU
MCIGSITTVECAACGSIFDMSSYLGCATYEHAREGWKDRADSTISKSIYTISSCEECSEPTTSYDSDAASVKSIDTMAEDDYESNDVCAPYYSLGKSSALAAAWSERAASSLESFSDTMSTLIDRVVALSPSPATVILKLNILLIGSECDAYLRWTETEHERAVITEDQLYEALNITGTTKEVNATIVEDMTADMVEMFENLTAFHPYYDAKYNAGRFNGYLPVLIERLEKLEAQQFTADVAAASAFVELTDA